MCKFEENVITMTFENCNLFRRSFTTQGLGYTFNNEVEGKLIKKKFRSSEFSQNIKRKPSHMKSTGSEHSLTVIIDSNAEEVEKYENITGNTQDGDLVHKPKEILVSLHNPKEPADTFFIPATSIKIPLGYSTTFFITPNARDIDESGRDLEETKRKCRLMEDTKDLNIFNIYSKAACLFECKMRLSFKKCGCVPWNYPFKINDKVTMFDAIELKCIVM